MKHRSLSQLIITPLLLVLLMSGVLSSLSPLLQMPRASAAVVNTMGDYSFDTPSDDASLAALKKAIADGDPGGAALSQTVVYVRNQVFGGKAFALNYDQSRTSCAHAGSSGTGTSKCDTIFSGGHFGGGGGANDVWVYTGTYTCLPNKPAGQRFVAGGGGDSTEENYVVNYSVSLKMGSGGQYALFNGDKIGRYAWLHWMGFGDNNNPGVQHTGAAQPNGTARAATEDVAINKLPPICHPPDVPNAVLGSGSKNTEENKGGITNKQIPILASADTPQSTKNSWKAAGVTAPGTGTGSANQGGDQSLACESGNPLGWIQCVLIEQLAHAIQWVDNLITGQLALGTVNGGDQPSYIFADSNGHCSDPKNSCANYQQAWQAFRNIALGLLVLVGLFIVISQALGMEILDAYTVRKTLPRLLIAALGITLSWPLMQFLVTLSNDLGYGLKSLLESPFPKAVLNINFGNSLLAGGALTVGYLSIGALGILLLALAGALAVFIAILVLILRQVVVILLIILSPIALVAFVLPNTQRVYKLWYESFSKALLMFPLIVGLIAAGHIFAGITSTRSHDFIDQVIGFTAYFAPYFMIPATFKLSGGIMSALGGGISSRAGGLFNSLSQKRKANTASRVKAFRSGGLYNESFGKFGKEEKGRSIGKILNKLGAVTLDGDEEAAVKLGSLGVPGFKSVSTRKKGEIDDAKIEQNQKAAQAARLHYTAGWAIAGDLEKFAGTQKIKDDAGNLIDWSDESAWADDRNWEGGQVKGDNRAALVKEYGKFGAGGVFEGSYRAAHNGDVADVKRIASILATGDDGSNAVFAARQLDTRAGTLATLTNKSREEYRRGDMRTIGLMTAASQGQLDLKDQVESGNEGTEFAVKRQSVLEAMATPKRQEQAEGKGTRVNTQGQTYSVFDNDHYTSSEALTVLLSRHAGEVGVGKAEYYNDTAKSYEHFGDLKQAELLDAAEPELTKRVHVARAEEIRKFIVQQSGIYGGGDPGAKVKLQQIKANLGIDAKEEEKYMRGGYDPDRAAGLAPPPAGEDQGPAPTPPA